MLNERHAEMTKHFRGRLKAAGIKARCRGFVSCGWAVIQINVPTFEAEFTEAEQRTIRHIAECNGLKLAHGLAIDINTPCPKTAEFTVMQSV